MRGRPNRLLAAVAAAVSLAAPAPAVEPLVLLVHLPGARFEAASRLVEAVTNVSDHLAQEVPGLMLEPEVFRRLSDAQLFLASHPERVALVLCDPAFLLDLPPAVELRPSYRLTRAGRGTYRRLVVVRAERDETRLADLRGKSLAAVEVSGVHLDDYLGRAVFAGEVDPAAWFDPLVRVADDFAAVTSVLFSQTDAALVAEDNPLLAAHRQELRVLYRSPPLSLPVVAHNPAVLDAGRRQVVGRALAELRSTRAGRRARAMLAIDGIEQLDAALQTALATLPAAPVKPLSIVVPGVAAIELTPPPVPAPSALRLALPVALPPAPPLPGGAEPRP
ncbi:MAG: hypothetical protein D6696_01215 [Acidobacteria bacterium]|nr:MAG: hypothetical protein D6696_01215 [Acidobacteriota bacterium]